MNNVSVEREFDGGAVTLVVENHSDRTEELEITDIVSSAVEVDGDADSFEMDGEWYVRWQPSVPAGETAELTYRTADDADFDLSVSGVETQKLTVNA
jgi:DNA topoisomerase-6 subunit B